MKTALRARRTSAMIAGVAACFAILAGCDNLDTESDTDTDADADAGDDTDDDATEYVSCDPLATETIPTELEDIIALGRDTDGTIYLADWGGGIEERVFVSEGNTLYRKEVSGLGDGWSEDVFTCSLTAVDGDSLFTLSIEVPDDGDTLMAVAPGDEELPIEELAALGEWLEVLEEDAVADYEVENLPGEKTIMYLGQAENGDYFLVVRPTYDYSYGEIRLFVGAVDDMRERVVDDLEESSYDINFYFEMDGESASFQFEHADGSEAYLKIGDEQFGLTMFDADSYDTSDFEFMCLE